MVCELCDSPGGVLIFAGAQFRIIDVQDDWHPAFYRVIWNAHVREMTDLSPDDRSVLMKAVFAVESAFRAVLKPTKINLASLGNQTPHLHWHVIARFDQDPHFPAPVWAERRHTTPVVLPAGWSQAVKDLVIETLGNSTL